MNLEKLEQLKQQVAALDVEIQEKVDERTALEEEIRLAQTMQDDVNNVTDAEVARQKEIEKYYDPKTKKWSKESDKLFSANDKKELEKFFNGLQAQPIG